MHRAWDNAGTNGRSNCVFYTRDPTGVLRKLHAKGERVDVAVLTSRGRAMIPELFTACREAGIDRLVYGGHSLTLLATDVATAGAAGYRAAEVHPVDLLPQTSHVHCVVQLVRQD
jgi:23S rRNA (uracil1939-C5)-methyltransferase